MNSYKVQKSKGIQKILLGCAKVPSIFFVRKKKKVFQKRGHQKLLHKFNILEWVKGFAIF